MKYNKLVRDLIPGIIARRGQTAVTHIADEHEYRLKLHEKLTEEQGEFLATPNQEELADLLEVVRALMDFYGWRPEEVEAVRQKKFNERGGFSKRLILDEA